jgi:hypothetical protein
LASVKLGGCGEAVGGLLADFIALEGGIGKVIGS